MPRTKRELSDPALQMIADRFKVLSEPMRLKILHSLWDGERTVGEIITETAGLQANVSKHLGILQQAGLVSRRKDGRNLALVGVNQRIHQALEMTRVDSLFQFYPSVADAEAA